MSSALALILLFLALALTVSIGVALPRTGRSAGTDSATSNERVESELLRRRLRSRRPA